MALVEKEKMNIEINCTNYIIFSIHLNFLIAQAIFWLHSMNLFSFNIQNIPWIGAENEDDKLGAPYEDEGTG